SDWLRFIIHGESIPAASSGASRDVFQHNDGHRLEIHHAGRCKSVASVCDFRRLILQPAPMGKFGPSPNAAPPVRQSHHKAGVSLDALQSVGRILNRFTYWRYVGYAISAAIVIVSATVLYRILKNLRIDDILTALKEAHFRNVLAAILCVVAVFSVLTFYDFFALRTIGYKKVPYRIAALSSFASFSIGHNTGAVVLVSAAVRYRVYSAWGLSAIDVAKVCFVTGLTFWLGNACVLGLSVVIDPHAASAVDQLPPHV